MKAPARSDAGLTLIEMLAVVAVLATVAVGAVLMPGLRGGETDMARFAAAFAQTRSLAIAGRETRAVIVSPAGLALARRGSQGWTEDSPRPWRAPEKLGPRATIRLLPDGRSDSFQLQFSEGRCESDGITGLQCAAS